MIDVAGRTMNRREMLKYGAGGMAALVIGPGVIKLLTGTGEAATLPAQTVNFRLTDCVKEMHTHNASNPASVYHWCFKEDHLPPSVPGPTIYTTHGQVVQLIITNDLPEPHGFTVPGMYRSKPIAPGATVAVKFRATRTGTFIYHDHLNAPVNRVMGLHGAFIVMPRRAKRRHRFTPYATPTKAVQRLFDDLGTAAWWPGLPWEASDAATSTQPFRQFVWLLCQSSSRLFAEVGNLPGGSQMSPTEFMDKFLRDPFVPNGQNRLPEFFTINGQSGHFSHNNPFICPMLRVGEPCVIRILNAGLWTHSTHIHANHVYVVAVNGKPQTNPIWVDTFTAHPMDTYDWVVPYMRPPDIPNVRGIGRADAGLTTIANPDLPASVPHPAWPPTEELGMAIPDVGERMGLDAAGLPLDLKVELSPLCFPMHDHSEPSQTSQGGNYNTGLISGINFIGDRNTPGAMTFPETPMLRMALEANGSLMGGYVMTDPAPPFNEMGHMA